MSDYSTLLGICREFSDRLRRQGLAALAKELDDLVGQPVLLEVPSVDRPRDEAFSWLQWFNREMGRSFTLNPNTLKLVRALIAQGYEQKDMRLVTLYLKSKWEGDVKMADFLVPSTILTGQKFGERLDLARAWWGER